VEVELLILALMLLVVMVVVEKVLMPLAHQLVVPTEPQTPVVVVVVETLWLLEQTAGLEVLEL
jgi:hypothetical protein